MSDARSRMEGWFAGVARAICRHPRTVLVSVGCAVVMLASQGHRVAMDTSPEGMLHEEDAVRVAYDEFRREFESDALIVVGVRAPASFDERFLERLDGLHRDLERDVPFVREVTSLVDARYTRGDEDSFRVGDLLEDWRAQGGDAVSLQRFAVTHPLYRDHFVSADGGLVALVIETRALVDGGAILEDPSLAGFPGLGESETPQEYFSQEERAEVVAAVKAVLARHEADDFETVLSGSPVIIDAFDRTTLEDTTRCVIASLVGIVLVLWFTFRRLSGVLLPNLVVGGSTSATIGLMGWVGAPFTLSSPGIFAILIAVGTCSAVHLLTIFYRALERNVDRTDAVMHAMSHSGPAIVMTSLTTAAGLLSFASAPLAATANVGLFSAFGVLTALVLTLVLLPAVLALCPLRASVRSPAGSRAADRALSALATFAVRRHRGILVTSVAVFVAGALGATSVRFAHDPVSYFDREATVRTDLEVIDRELKGGTTLDVVVDSGRENGLYDPALLEGIDRASAELANDAGTFGSAIRIFSVNDLVKETHQALHGNDPTRYVLPSDRATLSQELFLFEQSGSDDLARQVDPQFRKTHVLIKTPYADGIVYREFVDRVAEAFERHLDGLATVTVTGAMALDARAVPYALETMAESYAIAFVVISLMMIVFLGSVRIGLIAMFPNLLPIVAVMGLMGLAGAPLDQTSIVIGSIGLGLVVDDTIHFLYNFQKYHRETGDVTAAVERAFLGAGRAMIVTSVVLVAAFWVDLMATLSNVVRFGFLVGLIVIAALVTDFLVAPALMQAFEFRRRRSNALRRLGASGAATALLLMLPVTPAAGDEHLEGSDLARAIMERVHDRDDGDHVTMEIHMTLVDRHGRTRERHARSFGRDREGGSESVLFFLEPPEVRDTGFLTHDHEDPDRADDQWLYLPALGRSKRISSNEKSRPFMGSDFSYADMTRRSPERYDYALMGEVEIEGRPCWQIEATPNSDAEREETGYRRSIVFVDRNLDVVVRAVHWLDDSDEMKMMDVKRLERIDGIWTPLEVHMSTARGRRLEHRTILRSSQVDYRRELPAEWFTTHRLEKGP